MKDSLDGKRNILRQTEHRHRNGALPRGRQQIQVVQPINGRLSGQRKILLPPMTALHQLPSDEVIYYVELPRRVQDRALSHRSHHVRAVLLDLGLVVGADVGLPAAVLRGGVSLVALVLAGFKSAQEGHVDYLVSGR